MWRGSQRQRRLPPHGLAVLRKGLRWWCVGVQRALVFVHARGKVGGPPRRLIPAAARPQVAALPAPWQLGITAGKRPHPASKSVAARPQRAALRCRRPRRGRPRCCRQHPRAHLVKGLVSVKVQVTRPVLLRVECSNFPFEPLMHHAHELDARRRKLLVRAPDLASVGGSDGDWTQASACAAGTGLLLPRGC